MLNYTTEMQLLTIIEECTLEDFNNSTHRPSCKSHVHISLQILWKLSLYMCQVISKKLNTLI